MEAKNNKILKFISAVRDSFVGSQQVYTNGSCYYFYLILKEVFDEAEAYYDGDHIITKIEDKFYDITGEVAKPNSASRFDQVPLYGLANPFNIYVKRYE
jgi:hypothetical protein